MNNDIPQSCILLIESVVPYRNLALENSLFENLKPNQSIILLWQNSNCVVIGRAQNPWLEANLNYTVAHNIPVLRRHSGGGTVFNDNGNINFTFMAYKPIYNRNTITQQVNQLLLSLGLDTYVNERNDILLKINGKLYKISGSAYQETTTKGLHHATLLVSSDLTKLRKSLQPNNHNLIIKGITSTRTSVANISDTMPTLSVAYILTKLVSHFQSYFSIANVTKLDNISESKLANLNKQTSWEWNFGATPPFVHILEDKILEHEIKGQLKINRGIIDAVDLSISQFNIQGIDKIKNLLLQCRYQADAINQKYNAILAQDEKNNKLTPFIQWLSNQIN